MSHLQDFHKELSKQPPQGHHAIPTMRLTGQMLGQKAVQFEVWKLRMTSLEKRIQNVINLVNKLQLLLKSIRVDTNWHV